MQSENEFKNLASTFRLLLENRKVQVNRPGIYYGTHFYFLEDDKPPALMWAYGADGDACETDLWVYEPKKDGDTFEQLGLCQNTGMYKYRISLI